jgi:membrane-associated phospholipid phosphatase
LDKKRNFVLLENLSDSIPPYLFISNVTNMFLQKKSGSLLVFICIAILSFGQSPYQFSLKKESAILASGLGTTGISILLKNKKMPLDAGELNWLNPNNIPPFERFVTANYSESAQKTSDQLVYASTALPFAMIALDKEMRKDLIPLGFMTTEVFLMNYGLTNLVKESVKRKRPFVYNSSVSLDEKTNKDATASFYSGHTSTSASMCFAAASMFSAYHPDSKWKPVVWTVAAILPAATAYYRVRGGKHFITDVATGYAMGALTGILIPRLHLRKR